MSQGSGVAEPRQPRTGRRSMARVAPAVALAVGLVVAVFVLVAQRDGEVPLSGGPLVSVPDFWPPDGAVERSSVDTPFGRFDISDVPEDAEVCVLWRTADRFSAPCFSQETYESGLGWGLIFDNADGLLLQGIAPRGSTVEVNGRAVDVDEHGLWYVLVDGAGSFTIRTPCCERTERFDPAPPEGALGVAGRSRRTQ